MFFFFSLFLQFFLPRCIYSDAKLNQGLKSELSIIIENGDYFCGGSLLPDNDSNCYKFAVKRQLACHIPMEVPYYSAKVVQLPPVCYHCGGASKALYLFLMMRIYRHYKSYTTSYDLSTHFQKRREISCYSWDKI